MPAEPVVAAKALPFNTLFASNRSGIVLKQKPPLLEGIFSAVGFGSLLFNKTCSGKPVLT